MRTTTALLRQTTFRARDYHGIPQSYILLAFDGAEQVAKFSARLEQLTTRRAGADAELRADFIVRITFDIEQYQHRSISSRKRRNRRLDVHAVTDRADARFDVAIQMLQLFCATHHV